MNMKIFVDKTKCLVVYLEYVLDAALVNNDIIYGQKTSFTYLDVEFLPTGDPTEEEWNEQLELESCYAAPSKRCYITKSIPNLEK